MHGAVQVGDFGLYRGSRFGPYTNVQLATPHAHMTTSVPVARHDQLAERIRLQIKHQMDAKGLEAKDVARLARERYPRVTRFLRGDMPYPPLQFLDRLLGVFGYTLAEALAQAALPLRDTTPPAIFRPLVMEIAALLERRTDAELKPLKQFFEARGPKRKRA